MWLPVCRVLTPHPPIHPLSTQFLVGEKTFNEDRVRKSVEKIRASKGKANQNRLESFFGAGTITHSTLGKRPVDDKAKGKGKAGAAAGAKKPKGVGGVGGKGGK